MSGFLNMLRDLNITKEQLNDITLLGEVLEFKSNSYYKGNSNIHNIGVFASKDIYKHDIIGIGSIDKKYKTTLGSYCFFFVTLYMRQMCFITDSKKIQLIAESAWTALLIITILYS